MTDIIQTEITKALTSSLGSGAKELSELIADKVRFLRWKSAVRTLEKAKLFSEPYGGLMKVPPLNFFLPFMETCSLEEEDEDVVDMWAHLLVAASIEFRAGHLLFMRLLREITGSEARLLRDIAHANRFERIHSSALDDAIAGWQMFSAHASPLKEIDIKKDWNNTKRYVFEKLQLPGVMIEHLGLYDNSVTPKNEIESVFAADTILCNHDRISLDILVSLNIVEKVEQYYFQKDGHLELNGVAFCTTAMGAAFYTECAGQDVIREKG